MTTGTISASLDVDEVLRAVTTAATEITDSAVIALWTADDGRPGAGVVEEVTRTRQPVHTSAMHAVPILHEDAVLGVLTCTGGGAHGVLAPFLEQAAIALRNAKLFEDSRRRERETAASYDLARRLSTRLSVEQILDAVVDGVVEALACDGAASYRWNAAKGGLVYVRGRNHDETMIKQLVLRPGQGVSGRAYAERRAIWTRDRAQDPNVQYTGDVKRLFAQSARFRGYLAVPILFRDEVVGILGAHYYEAHEFTPREVEVMSNLAALAATAIETARLYEQSEARRHAAEVLADVTHGLTQSLEPDLVHRQVLASINALLGTTFASLVRVDRLSGDQTVVAVSSDGGATVAPGLVYPRHTGVVGRAVAERRPVFSPHATKDPRITLTPEQRPLLERATRKAMLAVPLILKDEVIGGLLVADLEGRVFDDDEVRLAQRFADQAALALHNADIMQELTVRQERLEEQAAVLRTRNAELDSFAYAVSHDLKAPLVSLQGMAGLLAEECGAELGEQGAHYLARIGATVDRMERLVRDVLILCRTGRGDRPANTVDLDDVVDGVLQELAEPLKTSGVTVTRGDLGTVRADRTEMEQVFSNLIGNALKYMGEEAAAPAIEIGRADRDAWVEYFVRDTGIGIAPEYHAKIFETFQRLQEIQAEGTGVGLAIVKKIVETAGGRLRVESAVGQGSTFFFTWPQSPRAIKG